MSDQIDQMLALKTWAVVGLSNNPDRAAFGVAKLLIEKGHTVIPVHPKAESVHGQTGYAKLSDIPVPVDVVDIFVNSDLAGAVVTVHDPKAIANAQKRFPALNFAADIEATLKDAELVLHLTEWKIYRELDPVKMKSLVKSAIMIDGRNALDRDAWRAAGWHFRALGRADSN